MSHTVDSFAQSAARSSRAHRQIVQNRQRSSLHSVEPWRQMARTNRPRACRNQEALAGSARSGVPGSGSPFGVGAAGWEGSFMVRWGVVGGGFAMRQFVVADVPEGTGSRFRFGHNTE